MKCLNQKYKICIYWWCLFLIFYLPVKIFAAEECHSWFQRAQLRIDKNCFLKCTATSVNRYIFYCPDLCGRFCKRSKKERLLFKVSKFYPGLTDSERALIAIHPMKMLKSYILTWKADHLCLSIFRRSGENDASDACRHFVWAALLYEKWGQEFSQQVMNAHEQDRWQTKEEKAMDLANNRLGVIVAKQLLQENQFNGKTLLKSFQANWKSGHIVIIKDVVWDMSQNGLKQIR